MHPIIEQHRDELEAACCEFTVSRLEVFGSAATDQFDPERSDLDFLVVFDRSPNRNAFHQYFDFLHNLERLFGRSVDLVCARAMTNPYFIRSVDQSRKLVYANG